MNLKDVLSYILKIWLIISTLGDTCDDIKCSNIFDEVCGIVNLQDGTVIKLTFQNLCHMKKAECEQESFVEVNQVDHELCDLTQREIPRPSYDEYKYQSRRVSDFTIVGAHQVCNHSCPTYCTDAYDPACAQIWKRTMKGSVFRAMVNHCHIDMFSCMTGINVTIQPLGKCYTNPSGLLFMQHTAVLKSLGLIDKEHHVNRRNLALLDEDSDKSSESHLKENVRRIFEKYRIGLDEDESQ